MKLPTLNSLQLEMAAMQLYADAVRVQPRIDTSDDAQHEHWEPSPRWAELGIKVRQAYRKAVVEMCEEHHA